MLKHLHLLLTLFVLAIGGQVKAQESITFSEEGLTNRQKVSSFSKGDFTITFFKGTGKYDPVYYNTGKAVRVYGDGWFEISSATKKIASFVATYSAASNAPVNGGYSLSSGSIEGVETTTQTWTSADPAGVSSVRLTRTETTGHWRLQSVTVTYVDLSKTPTTLTFAEANKVFTVGAEGGSAAVSNVASLNPAVEGAVITYKSSNAEKAVVDNNGGVLVDTSVGGTYTITASYAGSETYAASSATYTISIEYPHVGAGTLENPYTVLDVIHLLEEGKTPVGIHVKGSVKEVGTVNPNFNSRTYTITDETKDLLIFSGKSFNGNTFVLDYQVAVGDEIVIKGNAKTYAGTSEMDYNNVVVSQTRNRSTTANKYGTICLPYAGTVTGGILYSVDGIVNGELTLTEVATPKAGVPYIFQANGEKLSVAFTAGAAAEASSSAYLVGVAKDTEATPGTYVLQTIHGVQKFRIVADVKPIIPAGRAYLQVASAGGREFIEFPGTTTAINALEAITNNNAEIYDLNGRKLNKLQKGVNIVNGTKVVVK